MATKIMIQNRQFHDINTVEFADIDRCFRECKDILFMKQNKKIVGIVSFTDYLKGYYSGVSTNNDIRSIINYDFTFLYEDQINQAVTIFNGGIISSIPIFDKNETPLFVLHKTKYGINQTFICRCLTGKSTYNFSVNADLSVSCHCILRKAGELGNLRNSTLYEIFTSQCADNIRENLSKGVLLTVQCLKCPDLEAIPKSISEYYRDNYSFPKGLMIENTSVCNLQCKNCYNAVIENNTISTTDIENIAKQLSKQDIKYLSMFKYGETFADKEILAKISIIRKHLPNVGIYVSSNGMLLDNEETLEASLMLDYLTISLDGTDNEMLNKFQKGSNFNKVSENIKSLIKVRNTKNQLKPIVTWKFVMFEWTDSDETIETAFARAKEIGFDEIQFLAGWNVKEEEKSRHLFGSAVLLKYMNRYEFDFTEVGDGTITFNLKADKIYH